MSDTGFKSHPTGAAEEPEPEVAESGTIEIPEDTAQPESESAPASSDGSSSPAASSGSSSSASGSSAGDTTKVAKSRSTDPSRTAGTSGSTGTGSDSQGTNFVAAAKAKADARSGGKEGLASKMSSTPGAGSKLSNVAGKVLGKKNRTGLKIAIVTGCILLSILGFFLTIPFKLMHIANVLFHHNFRSNDHIETKAERQILRILFTVQLNDKTGHKSNTGKFLHDKLTNMRIDKFQDLIGKEGLKMSFDDKNHFIGVKDKTGRLVTDDFRDKGFWEKRAGVADLIDDSLSPHRYLQNALYTKAMRLHAGVSFKFWAKEKAGDLKQRLVSKVRSGLEGDKYLADSGRDPANDGAKDPKAANAGSGSGDAAGAADETSAEKNVFSKTFDMVAAHKAGISAFRAKAAIGFGVTGIGMLYCMLYDMVQKALKDGYLARTVYLMREGNMIVTMSHQMYTGTLNLDDFGEMMSRFDGDPNADPKTQEDSKDFTQSAAWCRDVEKPGGCSTSTDPKNFDHYNPDLSEAANPDAHSLNGIMSVISDMFNIPGAAQVCKVLNSWFGWVIMGAELAVAAFDGETSTAAAAVFKGALIGVLIQFVVPKLLDAATSLAVTGVENAVGTINNADAGLQLSAGDYGRLQGDRVGTAAEGAAVVDAARADDIAVANTKGWTYRAFAIDNNESIASKLLENAPTSPATLIAAIRTTIAALPSNFAAIFLRPKFAAADAGTSYADTYDFRTSVTTDAEIDKYDPLAIEDFLDAKVKKTDGTETTRLAMLGDPTDYTPADGGDDSTDDLMHCFVGMFRTPYDDDPICRDLGVLTDRNAQGDVVANPVNPGPHEISDLIYCKNNDVCGLPYNDDFNQYRMYLKYTFLTRGLDGLTTDTDPFAAKNAAEVAATFEVCQIPAIGADPSAPVPPNDYTKVKVDGQTINARTKFMLDNAKRYAKQLGYTGALTLIQGSYVSGGGANSGGGVIDISINDVITEDPLKSVDQRTLAVQALRMAGFAAWHREPPQSPNLIHAVAIGDTQRSNAANDQIKSYFMHLDGLSDGAPDPDANAEYGYPQWAGVICKALGLK